MIQSSNFEGTDDAILVASSASPLRQGKSEFLQNFEKSKKMISSKPGGYYIPEERKKSQPASKKNSTAYMQAQAVFNQTKDNYMQQIKRSQD